MNQRYRLIIEVREEHLEEYKRLHAAVWPDVLAIIRDSHIRNYSIYLRQLPDGKHYLFSHFEYTGNNFEADMARMAADPVTQAWWAVCKPCQKPLPGVDDNVWWAPMEEVFYFQGG